MGNKRELNGQNPVQHEIGRNTAPSRHTSACAAASAPPVAASSFWTPADPLGDGFDAPPLCRRQGQVLAGPLAQVSQAHEKLAVPTAEAPLMLQEFIDPLPGCWADRHRA